MCPSSSIPRESCNHLNNQAWQRHPAEYHLILEPSTSICNCLWPTTVCSREVCSVGLAKYRWSRSTHSNVRGTTHGDSFLESGLWSPGYIYLGNYVDWQWRCNSWLNRLHSDHLKCTEAYEQLKKDDEYCSTWKIRMVERSSTFSFWQLMQYVQCLREMGRWCFALDHPNYSRWLAVHIRDSQRTLRKSWSKGGLSWIHQNSSQSCC